MDPKGIGARVQSGHSESRLKGISDKGLWCQRDMTGLPYGRNALWRQSEAALKRSDRKGLWTHSATGLKQCGRKVLRG